MNTASGFLVNKIVTLASQDENEFVRMLAYASGKLEGEVKHVAESDDSELIKAACYAGHFNLWDVLPKLTQPQRNLVIGLHSKPSGEVFLDFIKDSLANQIIPPEEAAELVCSYVRNEKLIREFTSFERQNTFLLRPADIVFYEWWIYCETAPLPVMNAIAWEFPLGDDKNFRIPADVVNGKAQVALVWRGYKPLLSSIEAFPDDYSDEIKAEVAASEKELP